MGGVLIVDGDVDMAEVVRDGLRRRHVMAELVATVGEALERLERESFDVVVVHLQLSEVTGFELCAQLRDRFVDVLGIALTSCTDVATVVAATRAGACDILARPVDLDELHAAIERALAHLAVRRANRRARTDSEVPLSLVRIVGDSPAIHALRSVIRRVAVSDATVLITGESGTGKELVAHAIHDQSSRASEPFVAVNCAAIPPGLLESQLFGHVRGAFTDAKQAQRGLFVQAGHGTLFLDEIGEMPLEMQVKVLRTLQERVVRPVGGEHETPYAARLVTATNRDLEVDVVDKRFRQDLFYRINVVQVEVPPLRVRHGDVILLVQHFISVQAARRGIARPAVTDEAANLLVAYDWPGNVRELENVIERALALGAGGPITSADLPEHIRGHRGATTLVASPPPDMLISLAELERRYIREVMAAVGNNRTRAARVLGIDRRSLYRRLHEA